MKVIKRNGEIVKFESKKIFYAITKAMEETEIGVDLLMAGNIAEEIYKLAKDKSEPMNIEEIQDLVEELLMKKGRYEVAKRYILYREERNRERDKIWNMTDLQKDIYEKKYRFQGESFSQFLDRVSGGNSYVRKLMQKKKFLPAGRILANRGLNERGKKVCYSNCFVNTPPKDNLESIFQVASDMARTYSYGGGVGINLKHLRPRGAIVNNSADETTGAVSFMDLYSTTTGLIGMRGRRGALMITLPVDHPDIEDFIDVKNDLSKVNFANISIMISDDFMDAVENNTNWTMQFEVEDTGEVITKTIKARKLFRKIAESNHRMAEPGILFWDRVQSYHIKSEDENFEFSATNPCVTGETLILTDSGYVPIKDSIGSKVNVWNGIEFSEVEPKITGNNKEILDVKLSNGMELSCTPNHEFILQDGSKKPISELNVGDKLIKWEYPIIYGGESHDRMEMYTHGFFSGDGWRSDNGRIRSLIHLYEKKKPLKKYLDYTNSFGDACRDTLELDHTKYTDKSFVPSVEYSITSRLDWLAGILDSDGSLNDVGGSLSITSINREFLYNIQLLLTTLGCHSTVALIKKATTKVMPDGKGGVNEYDCKDCYRLIINSSNVKKLMDLGLETHRVELIANPNRDASRFIFITEISPRDNKEDLVYCFTEPKTHNGMFNGILTGQCGELPLDEGGSCLLSSINLSEYVLNPFTDDAIFDYKQFTIDIPHIVEFMDDLLEEGISHLPLEQQKESARKYRQIGIGVMGLADMFIKMGITYADFESNVLMSDIMEVMTNTILQSNALLAKERGAYPEYSSDVLNTTYLESVANDITMEMIGKYGLRNSQLLSIAPTGSISTMLGVSGGIEPIFAISHNRKSESLGDGEDVVYKVYAQIVQDYMEVSGITKEDELPEYFVTSHDIHYEDRIEFQGTIQTYVDNAISSTVNLPNSATVEDIEKVYQLAWMCGLKGITVYRDGCMREGILTIDKPKVSDLELVEEDCNT